MYGLCERDSMQQNIIYWNKPNIRLFSALVHCKLHIRRNTKHHELKLRGRKVDMHNGWYDFKRNDMKRIYHQTMRILPYLGGMR